jgi:hypothetical protein
VLAQVDVKLECTPIFFFTPGSRHEIVQNCSCVVMGLAPSNLPSFPTRPPFPVNVLQRNCDVTYDVRVYRCPQVCSPTHPHLEAPGTAE